MTKPIKDRSRKIRKCTKLVALDRTMEVWRLLKAGVSSMDIIRIGTEQWLISERAVELYITKAHKLHRETVLPSAQEFIKDAVSKLDMLFEVAYMKLDRIECRKILETKNKLLGLDKITVTPGNSMEELLKEYQKNKEEKKEKKEKENNEESEKEQNNE